MAEYVVIFLSEKNNALHFINYFNSQMFILCAWEARGEVIQFIKR